MERDGNSVGCEWQGWGWGRWGSGNGKGLVRKGCVYFYEDFKVACGGVSGEYGKSFLRSSGWNLHQNAVSHSSLVRKRVRVIVLLRARNCS